MLNGLSVDVEEWYQTALLNDKWAGKNVLTRLPGDVHEILDLFDAHQTKATFFIVGEVAEKYPFLLRDIARRGHEIASHGYRHRLINRSQRNEFYDDTKQSLDVLSRLARQEIVGYRACSWSLTWNTSWALDVLKSLGLRYDSSICPIGVVCPLSRFNHTLYNFDDDFVEFPVSTFQFFCFRLPFSGGMFLRFFPITFIQHEIAEANAVGQPVMLYFHSWEFNSDGVEFSLPRWQSIIQYGNSKSMKEKIKTLLAFFRFSALRDVLRIENRTQYQPTINSH